MSDARRIKDYDWERYFITRQPIRLVLPGVAVCGRVTYVCQETHGDVITLGFEGGEKFDVNGNTEVSVTGLHA